MKIALIHDYFSQDGGAEKVLKAFSEIWPEAPIFVLFHDREKIKQFSGCEVRESFLAKAPLIKKHFQWYLPLMPFATENYNLKDFDVVLSSTSAFCKGVITGPQTLHICYCHTPTRYLWTESQEYIANSKHNGVIKFFLPHLIHKLRLWDRVSADRVDKFIANSELVKKRIKKYYGRDSEVIYPPVEFEKFSISKDVGDYFVSGGRIVSYKRFDLIIQTFNRLGWKIKIFGDGPELENLKNKSKPNIQFLGRITDEEKVKILSQSKAFIHPQLEDLGITALEAMAAGRPVIAYGKGGVLETVENGKTGIFFYEQSWEELYKTLLAFDYRLWDSEIIREHARKFAWNTFKNTISTFVDKERDKFLAQN